MQIGSKGCIFLHPTCKGVKEICEILRAGGPISVPVSMLWTCSSPLRFHQIIEDSNCLSSENRRFDHNLSGRYALNWKDSREYSDVSQYIDPPIAGSRVCDKSKEVGEDPLTGDGVSWYGNKLQRVDFSLPEKNFQKVKLQCLDLYESPQVSILQLTKVLGRLTSKIQTVLPA